MDHFLISGSWCRAKPLWIILCVCVIWSNEHQPRMFVMFGNERTDIKQVMERKWCSFLLSASFPLVIIQIHLIICFHSTVVPLC